LVGNPCRKVFEIHRRALKEDIEMNIEEMVFEYVHRISNALWKRSSNKIL
jgi:hypothetical protein